MAVAALPALREIGRGPRRPAVPADRAGDRAGQLRATRSGAIDTLERALKVSPRNVPLTVRYGELLLAEGRARLAHQVLLDVFNVVPPTQAQIKLTAMAASSRRRYRRRVLLHERVPHFRRRPAAGLRATGAGARRARHHANPAAEIRRATQGNSRLSSRRAPENASASASASSATTDPIKCHHDNSDFLPVATARGAAGWPP